MTSAQVPLSRSPTMRDIARKVGVSPATVSLVLRNHPSISRETSERVLQAQKELGYSVNRFARQFVRSTRHPAARPRLESLVFALVNRRFDDLAYASFLEGVVHESQSRQIAVHTVSLDWSPGTPLEAVPLLRDKLADGIIVSGEVTPAVCEALGKVELPQVVIGTYELPSTIDHLDTDISLMAREATRRLIARGHRHIVFLTRQDATYYARRALAGYEEAFREARIPSRPDLLISADPDPGSDPEILAPLLSRPDKPSALFCTDGRLADDCVSEMRVLRRRLPEDLEIVALEIRPERSLSRRYPSVFLDGAAMGRLAVCRLKERVENPTLIPSTTLIRAVKWIEPKTVAPPNQGANQS